MLVPTLNAYKCLLPNISSVAVVVLNLYLGVFIIQGGLPGASNGQFEQALQDIMNNKAAIQAAHANQAAAVSLALSVPGLNPTLSQAQAVQAVAQLQAAGLSHLQQQQSGTGAGLQPSSPLLPGQQQQPPPHLHMLAPPHQNQQPNQEQQHQQQQQQVKEYIQCDSRNLCRVYINVRLYKFSWLK